MADVGHVLSLTGGSAGFFTGWIDQTFARASATVIGPVLPVSGHGSPIFTQVVSVSTASGDNDCFGGILMSPARRIALMRSLLSGSPDTTTGPRSLPLSRAARESRRSPAFCCLGPWQE